MHGAGRRLGKWMAYDGDRGTSAHNLAALGYVFRRRGRLPPTFAVHDAPDTPCSAPSVLVLPDLVRPWRAMAQNGKTKVVLYKDRLAAQFDTVKCVKNVIKINPLLFFRGEIPIYYERAISPNAEPGSGRRCHPPRITSPSPSTAMMRMISGPAPRSSRNLSFHIGCRYYFVDDLEPQGTYLQPGLLAPAIHQGHPGEGCRWRISPTSTMRDDRIYNDIRVLLRATRC